uniref:Uncharacterized protein n=1 Tax=Ditylenchus dipsaci TaxID=166011 RepID=A0A915CZ19_9BILA
MSDSTEINNRNSHWIKDVTIVSEYENSTDDVYQAIVTVKNKKLGIALKVIKVDLNTLDEKLNDVLCTLKIATEKADISFAKKEGTWKRRGQGSACTNRLTDVDRHSRMTLETLLADVFLKTSGGGKIPVSRKQS